MRKKKSQKKKLQEDYPVNVKPKDAKPPDPLKISKAEKLTADLTWDELDTVDDIVETLCLNVTDSTINNEESYDTKEKVYPEIVWYLLSHYILPEDVGRFAGINRATYAITHRESFWRSFYNKYCRSHPNLPEGLRIENNYRSYGLRQRVVRSLYFTYDVFVKKIQASGKEARLYDLTRRRCISVWFNRTSVCWSIWFKFKKFLLRPQTKKQNFIRELGRMDANPEQDSQVLQVTCRTFHEVPPLMGMILSTVSIVHSVKAIEHRLHLGFNTGSYAVGKNILPELNLVLDTVVNFTVYDWWHPKYPHPDNKVTVSMEDDEVVPILKNDFFSVREGELF